MERNQSGKSYDELNKMRLEFTDDYLDEIRGELTKLDTAYKSFKQEEMKCIVDDIIRMSRAFRKIIDGPSEEDGVYNITTEE